MAGRRSRTRSNESRPVDADTPLARLEFVDVVTGEPVRPAPPDRVESDGAAPTGRVVAEIEGIEVEIDPEDLVGGGEGHPRERRFRFDIESPTDYPARAREKAAVRAKARVRKPKKPQAFHATFRSAKEAAREFYVANENFFDHVLDPFDGLREWMDGVEVKLGRSTRRLSRTPTGQRILTEQHAEYAIQQALVYVFGKARGRRWDAVDWRSIELLGAALEPYFEQPSGDEPSRGGLYWRPVVGTATRDQLDELSAETREQLEAWEGAEEIGSALADLRVTYERNRECISPGLRRVVERRIAEWERWQSDPKQIPAYACEPDERTGGYTCNYPSIAGELHQLERACQAEYDADWAEPESRAGAPGFPDTSQGPEDPLVEPQAATDADGAPLDDERPPREKPAELDEPLEAARGIDNERPRGLDDVPLPEAPPELDESPFEAARELDDELPSEFDDVPFPEAPPEPDDLASPPVEPDGPRFTPPDRPTAEQAAASTKVLRLLADGGRAFGGPSSAVVERRELDGVTYQLEFRTCGKRCACSSDFPARGHGPYWYAYWPDRDGSRRSKYIGKGFRALGS